MNFVEAQETILKLKEFGRRGIFLTVYGTPRPQGSKRHVGKGIMVEGSKYLKPWRQQLSGEALVLSQEAGISPFEPGVPIDVCLEFYFQKPKSARRLAHTVKPDIDKLIRAVMDSLKGILIHDDSQAIEIHARKHYGAPGKSRNHNF